VGLGGRLGVGVSMAEKTISLSRIDADSAAQFLTGCEALDPRGMTTAKDIHAMTERGQCYAATCGPAQCVYVVDVKNDVAWVSAIKGTGSVDWTFITAAMIEAQAKGLRAVAFQTARAGLVRKMKKAGYEVSGYVMRKEIQWTSSEKN